MRDVYECGEIVYTFQTPTTLRIWHVLPGGHVTEITDAVKKADAQMRREEYTGDE